MMEEGVFPRPAVAGVLSKEFIEARLHNDGGPRKDENLELQRKKTGSLATPNYLIVDPKSGETLRGHAGPLLDTGKFIDFLRGKALD